MARKIEVPHFDCSKRMRIGMTALRGKAVLRAGTKARDLCARTLAQRKLPVENRLRSGDFDPTSNKIKVMTLKVSAGLEFPVGGVTRRKAYTCCGGGREGSGAGVFCGGYAGDATAAD